MKLANNEPPITVTAPPTRLHSNCEPIDPNARGLERGPVQRHGKDKPLGRTLFRGPHDIRQLRSLQLVGRHSRRRLQLGGNYRTDIVAAFVCVLPPVVGQTP